MNYFKALSFIFGLIAFLKPFYMHILPWDENKFIEKAYTKKRPFWVIPVGILGLLLVFITWYKYFTLDIKYSIIVTILFSLTSIKAIIFILDYEKFQKWVTTLLNKNKGKDIVIIDIGAGVFGLILILLAIFVY